MSDEKAKARVFRHRQARRRRGETETNVWIPIELRVAIEQQVAAGRFPNRRLAIVHALSCVFLKQTGEPQVS